MWKKWIKIGVVTILVTWMVINLNMRVDSGMNGSSLQMANIEALASTESGDWYYPCVKARGFCFVNGLKVNGVAFID